MTSKPEDYVNGEAILLANIRDCQLAIDADPNMGAKKIENFSTIIPKKSRDKVTPKLADLEAEKIKDLNTANEMYQYSPYPSNPSYKEYKPGLKGEQIDIIRRYALLSLAAIKDQLEDDKYIFRDGYGIGAGAR